MDCVLQAKSQYLHWELHNQDKKMRLKSAKAFSERDLQDRLKKQQLALEHELALLRTQQKAELTMLKIKSRQDIKDYREYLESLDHLKLAIANKYRELPEAMAFMIHHHAKQLLNRIWESEDIQQKIDREMQLIEFMASINDDIRAAPESGGDDLLPLKTLELLKK